MIRASQHIPAGDWNGPPAASITLERERRDRRRIALTSDGGLRFLLDLPARVLLRHGDGLVLEDGRVIEVRARPEPLLEVRAEDTARLPRLAWHLGNRHLEAQIEPARILIRRDRVIAGMLTRLGAALAEVTEPFDPEGGAYDGPGHGHGYNHGGMDTTMGNNHDR